MASLAKTLMDVYYGEELKHQNQGEYEIANLYGAMAPAPQYDSLCKSER